MAEKHNEHLVYKRYYGEKSTNLFKQKLHETTWYKIKNIKEPNKAYRKFLKNLSCIYKSFFPKKGIRVKLNSFMNTCVTKRIAKSTQKKQKLYEKYIKNRNPENEKIYKNHKSFFESVKNLKESKKLYQSEKLLKLQENAKQKWNVMKEITGKAKLLHSSHLPQKITLIKQTYLKWQKLRMDSISFL